MKRLFQLGSSSEAAEIAELAIVLPIVLSMIFAIFSFGRAYNIYSTITRAAQEGARVAVAPVCATCSGVACGGGGGGTSQFPCDSTVVQAVDDALIASHIDITQIIDPLTTPNPAACPTPAPAKTCAKATGTHIYICRNVVLNTNANSAMQSCGTIVTFAYHYQFVPIPFFAQRSVNIPALAQMQVEY
jgi:TadE-like protein